MTGKPGQEEPSRLDMLKVWLLDPRSRLALRRRLTELRLTRRSMLAAGMAVWLLYAALVWQFGGRRLDHCTSLACRVLLGGLPFGQGDGPTPAPAAGAAASEPATPSGQAPGTAPATRLAATTTTPTSTSILAVVLVPWPTRAPLPTAGDPTSTSVPDSTAPGSTTTSTTPTGTTMPAPECKPKKHKECKPKKPKKHDGLGTPAHRGDAVGWWWRRGLEGHPLAP